MHPQEADALGDGICRGGDHAGVAAGAEVLGGVEAESGRVSQCACLAPIPGGSERLGRIFDQQHAVLLLQQREAVPVRGLAIEVNRQNRSNGVAAESRQTWRLRDPG